MKSNCYTLFIHLWANGTQKYEQGKVLFCCDFFAADRQLAVDRVLHMIKK